MICPWHSILIPWFTVSTVSSNELMHIMRINGRRMVEKQMKKPLLLLIPVVVAGLIAGSAVIGMKSSAPATAQQAPAGNITGISNFSALGGGSTYQVRFSLVDKNNATQSSDFTGELRFVDLDNNTLYSQALSGKASDFLITQSNSTNSAYMIQVDHSAVHTELATSPEVARAQTYLNQVMQQHGLQSVEVDEANQMLQQTRQLAAESLTAIAFIQLPDGKTLTALTPVIG
jgi:hypothetical protein